MRAPRLQLDPKPYTLIPEPPEPSTLNSYKPYSFRAENSSTPLDPPLNCKKNAGSDMWSAGLQRTIYGFKERRRIRMHVWVMMSVYGYRRLGIFSSMVAFAGILAALLSVRMLGSGCWTLHRGCRIQAILRVDVCNLRSEY